MDVKMIIRSDKKNKRSSSGTEPNCLIHDYNKYNNKKYLNISVDYDRSHAGVAEWLTQSSDTRCPKGFVGSIPTSSVTIFSKKGVLLL